MKARWLTAWWLALSAGAVGPAAAGAGSAAEVRPYAHAKVRKVVIERSAAQARFAPEVDCKGLALDARRVRFFLAHAVRTDSGGYRRNAVVDDCSADARVVFSNGRSATVSIDSGTGWGAVSRGQRSEFLACDACVDILQPDFPFDARRLPSDVSR